MKIMKIWTMKTTMGSTLMDPAEAALLAIVLKNSRWPELQQVAVVHALNHLAEALEKAEAGVASMDNAGMAQLHQRMRVVRLQRGVVVELEPLPAHPQQPQMKPRHRH